jgi:non-heme chloroperoxidase
VECCATLPIAADVLAVLHADTLKCSPEHLGALMADHTALDWRPLLRNVRVPCLNVIGGRSGVFPVEGCREVSRLIPSAQPRWCACNPYKAP